MTKKSAWNEGTADNKQLPPEIARYILDNPTNYTFGAITASINAKITFGIRWLRGGNPEHWTVETNGRSVYD